MIGKRQRMGYEVVGSRREQPPARHMETPFASEIIFIAGGSPVPSIHIGAWRRLSSSTIDCNASTTSSILRRVGANFLRPSSKWMYVASSR